MMKKKWGRIIHISGHDGFTGISATGHEADGAVVSRPHNVAAKSGLHGFTKALAHELREHSITVNEVSPGVINTSRNPHDYPNVEQAYQKLIHAGRVLDIGSPADVAQACVFLCQQSYITGQVIHVNGGLYMP
jgi:NAD(P)-dependent dehydrogenase (short-subunit alcohol dehydrogenase family)